MRARYYTQKCMLEVQPLDAYEQSPRPWIFLAGSIDGGGAQRWQDRVVAALSQRSGTVLNPRRDDWDGDWKEDMSDHRFRRQVEWEMKGLESADLVLMYFAPDTRSPITLLELGLFARSSRLVVCCPDGYWKKGNVDIICVRYGVPTVLSLDELIARALERPSA
jgi:hypothetical protein